MKPSEISFPQPPSVQLIEAFKQLAQQAKYIPLLIANHGLRAACTAKAIVVYSQLTGKLTAIFDELGKDPA